MDFDVVNLYMSVLYCANRDWHVSHPIRNKYTQAKERRRGDKGKKERGKAFKDT